MRKTYDCFTFFNELDLLELRLRELDACVDQFVLVESTLTFTGTVKPLHFKENIERFSPWIHKITHIVVDSFPAAATTSRAREHHQRDAIMRGLEQARPDDFVILSDVDEIPRPDKLRAALADPRSAKAITTFESEGYFYYLNLHCEPRYFMLPSAPRLIQRRYLRNPRWLRRHQPISRHAKQLGALAPWHVRAQLFVATLAPLQSIICHAGAWHFTYMGGAEKIRLKLSSYAHEEIADWPQAQIDSLSQKIKDRRWIYSDTAQLVEQPLDETMPVTLREHREVFAHMLLESAQA
ncbi:MAG: hypothetical protein KGQ46_10120 [Hyphomicrobiales bacterium]|nr:hypothetical protein [Hyphomicrobiales bacterium]MDE2116163.1 hypothetical protein [Hyphomicrobiales bacterium]